MQSQEARGAWLTPSTERRRVWLELRDTERDRQGPGDRARAPHTGVSRIISQGVDSRGQSSARKMLLTPCETSLTREDGLEGIPTSTHLLACPSATHRCCHRHDCCYTRAEQAGCSPKMERYSWQCVNQSIVCGESPAPPAPTSVSGPGPPGCNSSPQLPAVDTTPGGIYYKRSSTRSADKNKEGRAGGSVG